MVKRVIHTTADFDYVDNLCISEGAVQKGMQALKNGACIVTDTQMARSGINKKKLAQFGGEVFCFISDEDVAAQAKQQGYHPRHRQHGKGSQTRPSAHLCHRQCAHRAGQAQ